MKTIKQTIADNIQYKKLINAVLRKIDKDQIQDVIRSGANAGFNGFIYYPETFDFYKKNKKQILLLVNDLKEQLGI